MGKVFDVYFNFGECGKKYLGRILAGLDLNSTHFGDLPPFFKKDMNDDVIKQGMTCMYIDLLNSQPYSVSILPLCFTSVIYRIEFIKEVIDEIQNTSFLCYHCYKKKSYFKSWKGLLQENHHLWWRWPAYLPISCNWRFLILLKQD